MIGQTWWWCWQNTTFQFRWYNWFGSDIILNFSSTVRINVCICCNLFWCTCNCQTYCQQMYSSLKQWTTKNDENMRFFFDKIIVISRRFTSVIRIFQTFTIIVLSLLFLRQMQNLNELPFDHLKSLIFPIFSYFSSQLCSRTREKWFPKLVEKSPFFLIIFDFIFQIKRRKMNSLISKRFRFIFRVVCLFYFSLSQTRNFLFTDEKLFHETEFVALRKMCFSYLFFSLSILS